MDLGSQVGTENPIRSDQIQVRSGQIRSDQAKSGQVRLGQVRSGQIRSEPVRDERFVSGTWRGEGFTRHEGMGPPSLVVRAQEWTGTSQNP